MSVFTLNEYGWAFVRRWHVLNHGVAWSDAPALPALDEAKVQSLFKEASQQPVRTSDSGKVNLSSDGRPGTDLRYAAITVKSGSDQLISIHTGSQGTLRVWVNGILATQVTDEQKIKPDSQTASATLKQGDNSILVEVGHEKTAAAFFLRLTNSAGSSLRVMEDGGLQELKSPELLGDKK
jgi:hypothetical protein